MKMFVGMSGQRRGMNSFYEESYMPWHGLPARWGSGRDCSLWRQRGWGSHGMMAWGLQGGGGGQGSGFSMGGRGHPITPMPRYGVKQLLQ